MIIKLLGHGWIERDGCRQYLHDFIQWCKEEDERLSNKTAKVRA